MAVILLVIVVNTSVGVTQEVCADRAITALTELTAPVARVVRDGTQRQIPAAEVVTGDLLVLADGDIVLADARVSGAAALLLDESARTVVVRGRSRAEATDWLSQRAGCIAGLMVKGSGLTQLQRRLVGVGRLLA